MSANSVDPFKWKRHGAEWRLVPDRRVVGRVVPDEKWPGMWRVKLPGGLSEMVNLARARDAALDWSATPRCHKVLQQNQRRFSAPASPVRLNRRSLPSIEKRTGAARTDMHSPSSNVRLRG
jgi:hypothetical protein